MLVPSLEKAEGAPSKMGVHEDQGGEQVGNSLLSSLGCIVPDPKRL